MKILEGAPHGRQSMRKLNFCFSFLKNRKYQDAPTIFILAHQLLRNYLMQLRPILTQFHQVITEKPVSQNKDGWSILEFSILQEGERKVNFSAQICHQVLHLPILSFVYFLTQPVPFVSKPDFFCLILQNGKCEDAQTMFILAHKQLSNYLTQLTQFH